jgi:hypothetical protein
LQIIAFSSGSQDYFDFCTYYFLFYFRSLIIAAFVNVSDVMCDVGDNENDPTEKAAIAKATRKFRSQCWKEFEPILEDGVVVQARCKHCDKLMGARRGQGTSALLTHLKRCKKRSQALKIVQDLSSTLRSPYGSRLKDWSYDPDVSRYELLRMIYLHGVPLYLWSMMGLEDLFQV